MKRILSFLSALSLLGALTGCTDSTARGSILDEPEINRNAIDLRDPQKWSLASAPAVPEQFPESSSMNDVSYGNNRALLAWYTIDPVFTQRNSTDAPGYINRDNEALSYPYAREISIHEVYPRLDVRQAGSPIIQTLNLSFYPKERGPYNLDGTNVDQDGNLLYPERRWGGIMCKIDNTNLEQENIKYIQFWLLDPFLDPELGNQAGGYLYINLGEVSEDVLKDGLMSHEYGAPLTGTATAAIQTVWGKVHAQDPKTYAFDNTDARRRYQDVGLDGLINQDEFTHPAYASYLNELRTVLSESAFIAMLDDPFSPFNDPAGDNYAYYMHNYYDTKRSTILERYKHYNGTDGNSLPLSDATDSQYKQARSTPDVEDINYSGTLDEDERFFQYRIAIHPDSMQVGRNYITDKLVSKVHARNWEVQAATWYQFTIPLADYQRAIGSIQNFSNIRFMRMYMIGFKGTTHLRFAALVLTPGD